MPGNWRTFPPPDAGPNSMGFFERRLHLPGVVEVHCERRRYFHAEALSSAFFGPGISVLSTAADTNSEPATIMNARFIWIGFPRVLNSRSILSHACGGTATLGRIGQL